MSKSENFITNTDFATLKHDASGNVSVVVPGSINIASGSYWQSTSDLVIGTKGSVIRARISSTRDNKQIVSHNLFETVSASSPGGATYYVAVDIYRINPTTVRLSVYIPNIIFPAQTLITNASGETITAHISTFLSPFNS